MNEHDENQQDAVDEKIDGVLSGASPRPAPRSSRKLEIYGELRGEWLASISAKKRARRYIITGMAASIVAAVVLTLQMNIGSVAPPDAVLVRSEGAGTTLNGRPVEERTPVNAPLQFQEGDVLTTGADAAVAISWNKLGSLRISSASSVVFVSKQRVELVAGEIYYDSKPHDSSGSSSIIVQTPFGQIDHVGTQFAASLGGYGVSISVREGVVSFANGADSVQIDAGQSAFVDRSLAAAYSPINATDGTWSWAARVAPHIDVDGRSTREIIEWLSRETGRVVKYDSVAAEEYAGQDRILGIGEIGPERAMSIVERASDLRFTVDRDVIRVELEVQ